MPPLITTPAVITTGAISATQSMRSAAEADGGPTAKPGSGRLRASQINAYRACAGKVAGQAGPGGETGKRLLDEATAAPILPIATTGVFSRLNVAARPVAGSWRPA